VIQNTQIYTKKEASADHRLRLGCTVPPPVILTRGETSSNGTVELKLLRLILCCVTKHHAMKAYWGSGVIAPLIL
jgi:hypothetical protein